MKKFFKKIKKKLRPLLLIPLVLLAGLLVGGYFLFFAGDDDSDNTANTAQAPPPASGDGSDDETTTPTQPKVPKPDPGPPPGKEFTVDSDRDEKDYAIAQAIGTIRSPQAISVRIGAAPKQPVTVISSTTCTQSNEGAKSSQESFTVTPPITRGLKLAVSDAVKCELSVQAQLTQAGRGRIKVFLTGTRRAGT